MDETRAFHDEVAATERWFASPRFRETARPYSAQVSSKASEGSGRMWMRMRMRMRGGGNWDLGVAEGHPCLGLGDAKALSGGGRHDGGARRGPVWTGPGAGLGAPCLAACPLHRLTN